MSEPGNKKTEYDLRGVRVQQIGRQVGRCERRLEEVYEKQTLKKAQQWFSSLRTLWRSVKPYVSDDKTQQVENRLQKFYAKISSDEAMEKLERQDFNQLHDLIQKLRIEEAGLNIPQSSEDDGRDLDQFAR